MLITLSMCKYMFIFIDGKGKESWLYLEKGRILMKMMKEE